MAFVLDKTVQKELITGAMIPQLRKRLVAGAFAQTQVLNGVYSINFVGFTDSDAQDYTGNISPEDITDISETLALDKSIYKALRVDEIDNKQAAVDVMGPATASIVAALDRRIDEDTFDIITSGTTAEVTSLTVDKTNVVRWILDMGVELDNANVPRGNRALAVTPAIASIIAEANLPLTTSTAEAVAKEGYIGRFGGFDIYISLQLVDGTNGTYCIAGSSAGAAVGIGANILKAEDIPGQIKWQATGVINYGIKVINPDFYVKCDVVS